MKFNTCMDVKKKNIRTKIIPFIPKYVKITNWIGRTFFLLFSVDSINKNELVSNN